jgi:TolB protein
MEPGPQLYVMAAGGGSAQRITYDVSRYCAEPDWSRAAPNKIAFTMAVGHFYQIGVVDLSTRHGEQVSKAAFDGVEPSWLPDGRHLVYSARSASTSRICILDTVTNKSTPVSPTAFGQALQASVWSR